MFNEIFTDMPDFKEHGIPVCAQTDPDLFFPQENFLPDGVTIHSSSYISEKSAKQLCNVCPYVQQCLQYALANPELQGLWGGTTERERKNLRRQMSRGPVIPLQIKPQ